ncbi:hypothetical protein BRADI_1g35380v3 [Brachypodium distachyon]|uniref:KIB1-4 beta-propeller domain-containing protein n=1 Tax=Brachypodium distachyon TaxID=15368 RepID=I1GX34_BRADI|nr:hypothetical protein BRADI_1g35380v3 [Brachypodium distachyon]
MADWSVLPNDLVVKISELVLANEDLDHYVDFRAVCPQWRCATADPSMADGFELTNWMMLERELDRSTLDPGATGVVTFVNLGTGRFLLKDMPRLRSRYFFVGAAAGCGLLVLGEKAPPHRTLVYNPFTGAEIQFRAPIPAEQVNAVAVTTVTSSSSSSPSTMRVFIFTGHYGHSVIWADERSPSFQEARYTASWPEPGFVLQYMAASAGAVHATNTYGSIISSTDVVAEEKDEEESGRNIITMAAAIPGPSLVEEADSSEPDEHRYFLVRSEGELLLVRGKYRRTGPVVYKVDTVNKVLVPLRSIGSRAIFVSDLRCLALDASKFPTVQPGIIYYAGVSLVIARDYENVAGGWTEVPEDLDTECLECCCRPVTLPQIFANYCRAFEQHSELEKMLLFGDNCYTYSEWNEMDGNGE